MPKPSLSWLHQARAGWQHRGARRPEFAQTPQPGQESVWDYPRPPALVADQREVVVSHGEIEVARSRRSYRVLETASPPTFYLPPEEVNTQWLTPSPTVRSFCEWKGEARYWLLKDAASAEPVAWTYLAPYDEFAPLAGYFAFYPGRVTCQVAGETVRPQSSGFYGGWVTDDIVGPFKGEPGTSGW